MDEFNVEQRVMVAQVPVNSGVRTLYARIGDLFAWLCVAGLVGAMAWAVLHSRQMS